LTGQTNASWPDELAAWFARRDPQIAVLKKEYRAGPFPRWNCWVKDPQLARGLVNEILAFKPVENRRSVWFVSHSNGAVIALQTLRKLAARGVPVAGSIFAGAAIQADALKNDLFVYPGGTRFVAWSSKGDRVTDTLPQAGESRLKRLRDWVWGRLAWPYGSLGATGWLLGGKPYTSARFVTRWAPEEWGHSGWWAPERREDSFEAIRQTLSA
jgi:hypothetical protein